MRKQIVGGLLLGAGAAYLFSSDFRRRAARAIGEARERHEHGHAVPDGVLADRVRTALRHAGANADAVAVTVSDGRVLLRGDVTEDERERLLQAVERVRGVDEIEDELAVVVRARVVRARKQVFDDGEARWSPALRLAAGLAGGAATLQGMRRRGPVGSALGMLGASMLRRAVAGRR
jgi:hypothetical protein